jgi:hypothetical protein
LANKLLDSRWMTALLHKLAKSAGVRDVAASWRTAYGPWFGNGVMTVTVSGDRWLIEVDHAALFGQQQILRRTMQHGG